MLDVIRDGRGAEQSCHVTAQHTGIEIREKPVTCQVLHVFDVPEAGYVGEHRMYATKPIAGDVRDEGFSEGFAGNGIERNLAGLWPAASTRGVPCKPGFFFPTTTAPSEARERVSM